MAAYHRVDDCGLTACTPGSDLGPMLGYEYGKHLTSIGSLYLLPTHVTLSTVIQRRSLIVHIDSTLGSKE